jgi:hypothetical protein
MESVEQSSVMETPLPGGKSKQVLPRNLTQDLKRAWILYLREVSSIERGTLTSPSLTFNV